MNPSFAASISTPSKPQTPSLTAIDSMTGVRILAALWVLISHLDQELYTWFPKTRVLEPFMASGLLGVDLFFILSGFIISYNYAARFDGSSSSTRAGAGHAGVFPANQSGNQSGDQTGDQTTGWFKMYLRFLWLRIARLYPVHLITLLAVLVMYITSKLLHVKLNLDDGYGAVDFIRNLFLVHAWFSYDFNWNGPSWSISAEWFAYLLFPIFAILTARVPARGQVLATLLVLLLLPVVNLFGEDNPFLNVLHLIRITTEFLGGCFLYRLYARGAGSNLPWAVLTPSVGLLIVGVAAFLFLIGTTPFWVVPLLAIFIYGVAQQQGRFSFVLAGPRMVFWGQVSYSLYMTHSIVRTVLRKALPIMHFEHSSILIRFGLLGLYAICFAGVAALTYLWIEEPARRWLRKNASF
jgi:peptidoglycan/LPS O-acetylase OafA/YrhL